MRFLSSVVVVVALTSGCMTVNADLPGTLRGDVAEHEVEKIGELRIEKGNWFFLWGLVGEPPADFFATDIQKAVQAKGGDGVARLKYESQESCLDWGLTRCTFALIIPRSYIVSGDIVRIKKPPLPGRPAKVAGPSTSAPNASLLAAQQF